MTTFELITLMLTKRELDLLYTIARQSWRDGTYYGDEAAYRRRLIGVMATLRTRGAEDEAMGPIVPLEEAR